MNGVQDLRAHENQTRIVAEQLQIDGEFLVGPEGKVTIAGVSVLVAGRTRDEARKALADGLTKEFGTPQITLDVAQSHSKVVYLIQESATHVGPISRIRYTDQLTVFDVLTKLHLHLRKDHLQEVVIASPTADRHQPEYRLAVDVDALFSKENHAANHPLLPGDRILLNPSSNRVEQQEAAPVLPPVEVNTETYAIAIGE